MRERFLNLVWVFAVVVWFVSAAQSKSYSDVQFKGL